MQTSNMIDVIADMIYHATNEMEIEYDYGMLVEILGMLANDYSIEIDETTEITTLSMQYVIDTINEWKDEMQNK